MKSLNAGKASYLAILTGLFLAAFFLGKTLTSVRADNVYCHPDNGVYPYTLSDENSNGSFPYNGTCTGTGNTLKTCISNWCGNNQPGDLCLNIDGKQTSVPQGYHQVGSNCYLVAGTCPTACGQQASQVPNGTGGLTNCQATQACVTDQCINIPGTQSQLPANMQTNSDHFCSCVTGFRSVDDGEDGFTCQPNPTTTPQPTPIPTPLSCSGDTHPDAAGKNCVSFQLGGAPQGGNGGGQVLGASTGPKVLGASTMAGTGTFTENLYLAIMTLGGTISALGIKNFKKAFKKA